MQNRLNFFSQDPHLANYNAAKDLFITYLNQTENKCLKLCAYKFDQERYYSFASVPFIEENKLKITNTKMRILERLDLIDLVSQGSAERATKELIRYGEELREVFTLSLFLTIFIGKITKRWLPVVNPQPAANPTITLTK